MAAGSRREVGPRSLKQEKTEEHTVTVRRPSPARSMGEMRLDMGGRRSAGRGGDNWPAAPGEPGRGRRAGGLPGLVLRSALGPMALSGLTLLALLMAALAMAAIDVTLGSCG